MTTPFLITGCGRSGTGWAAALFTALGYPCGHEDQFSWNKAGPLAASEASWLAVPHLDALPPRTPVLRIMRDPYAVVQSATALGLLRHGAHVYDQYIEHHRPDIVQASDHLGRVIRWAALWDESMDDRLPLLRTRDYDDWRHVGSVEGAVWHATGEMPPRDQVGGALRLAGSRTNSKPEERWVTCPTIEQIMAHPDGALIAARASKYGY